VDDGTPNFTGWWNVRDNAAGGNVGAVAVVGTGDAGFYASGAESSMLDNLAGGNGGAIYASSLRLARARIVACKTETFTYLLLRAVDRHDRR
jgi:predicted outer membrane repeat protein